MCADLAFRPAVELARMVADRRLSPVEAVTFFLDRIDRLDGSLNSVVTLDAEAALATARKQEALAGADGAPPLLGVPILVKDLTMTAGMRTTWGTATLARHVPDIDEAHVARLRAAGLVILGKTNVSEWGTMPFTESVALGPCRNPWSLAFTSGGSSGGAAAAAAAGLVPVAHGSDGAGSIRIPASNCGVFGLKPSRGRITKAPLYGDGGMGFGTPGPISRHVADAAALLDVMRGYEPGDPIWAPDPPRPYIAEAHTDPPPLRIGVVEALPWAAFSPAALTVLRAAVELFERLGHRTEPCTLPLDDRLREDFQVLWTAGLAANPVDHATFEPVNREFARAGSKLTAVRLLQANASLQQQSAAIVRAAMAYDVICSPALARPPLRIGELADLGAQEMLDALTAYVALTPLANITGQPSMSLPLGWTAAGGPRLPMGILVTGRPADETTLFQLAGQVERASDWPARRPPGFS